MAKRFTDTNKYKKPFMRALPGAYKLLWDFLYHDCDHSGIWIVDFEIAQMYVGKDMPINEKKAIELFNSEESKIVILDGGKKWFIPSFISFQYGQLTEKNRAHLNVIKALRSYGLLDSDLTVLKENKPLTSPLQGAKEKEQEKEKEQVKEKEGVQGETEFSDYERWTDSAVTGNDPLFTNMLRGLKEQPRERLPDLARSHLALLAKYPKMKPADQHRFRISLIDHIAKELPHANRNGKTHHTTSSVITTGKDFGDF